MTLTIDSVAPATRLQCDCCKVTAATDRADGRVPPDWGTGQLWVDISLSEQRQVALCFCPDCWPTVLSGSLTLHPDPSEA